VPSGSSRIVGSCASNSSRISPTISSTMAEGSWEGALSTVYCGLHRSRDPDSVADWWDRSRGPSLVWSDRTFEQESVEDEGREAQEPLDPEADYSVRCSGTFAGGRSTDAVAPVRWR
jgi:hypothetical protein